MSIPVMWHLLRERLAWRLQPRVPEPDMLMKSEQQTDAFFEAGHGSGVLAFVYFYNALQISPLLRPGDRVLDLACGPANQLEVLARIHPQTQFVGMDASTAMLSRARRTLDAAAVHNVKLMHGDMCRLIPLADASVDCVMCTLSLHHLPDTDALRATLRELRRVLKPQGGIYLMDFGRLKCHSTQHFFARDLQQSPQFTQDYFNSLRAAFSVDELSAAAAELAPALSRHVTLLAPFLVAFRSAARQPLDAPTMQRIQTLFASLSPQQQANFRGLASWFGASGWALPCALT